MNLALDMASSYIIDIFDPIKERLVELEKLNDCIKEEQKECSNKINDEKLNKNTEVKEEIKDIKIKEKVNDDIKENINENASDKNCIKILTKQPEKNYKINIKADEKITMQNRKICPVKIKPTENKNVKIKVGKSSTKSSIKNKENDINFEEEQHRLQHLIQHLRESEVQFTAPRRMPTGLYELDIIQENGTHVLISADINGLLYNDEIKFWLGKIIPGEEYNKPAIMMTKTSLDCIIKGTKIPTKYFVTETMFNLNKVLDMRTLKEKDPEKRIKVLERAAKVISDEDIYNGIIKASKGEPFRFAFCRYTDENEFSLVSSKRNLASNLDDSSNLLTTKEIWINVKNKEGTEGEYETELKCKKTKTAKK